MCCFVLYKAKFPEVENVLPLASVIWCLVGFFHIVLHSLPAYTVSTCALYYSCDSWWRPETRIHLQRRHHLTVAVYLCYHVFIFGLLPSIFTPATPIPITRRTVLTVYYQKISFGHKSNSKFKEIEFTLLQPTGDSHWGLEHREVFPSSWCCSQTWWLISKNVFTFNIVKRIV